MKKEKWKIGIITRHSVPNYGSLLQSYATQKVIEKLGYNSEIIDYTRKEEKANRLASTLIKGKKWDKNFFLRLVYKIIQTPNYFKMYKKFEKYRKGFLKETEKEYLSLKELEENPPEADIYCSGSDQIWGKIGTVDYDEAYFLEFVKEKKCISYASSLGKTELSQNLRNNIFNLLKKYSYILVREKSAKEILIENKLENVEQVLDPTFLLEKTEWEELSQKSNKKIKKKYVLVYQLHDNKEFNKYAKEFAKKKNLKLLRISPSFYHITRSGKLIYLPTQYDFLKYFQNAEYILTDSFHATVFSIIFNKQFIDIMPKNKTGTRIESILNLLGIENRILDNYNDFELIDKKINYIVVNKKIEEERKMSISLFKNAIEN